MLYFWTLCHHYCSLAPLYPFLMGGMGGSMKQWLLWFHFNDRPTVNSTRTLQLWELIFAKLSLRLHSGCRYQSSSWEFYFSPNPSGSRTAWLQRQWQICPLINSCHRDYGSNSALMYRKSGVTTLMKWSYKTEISESNPAHCFYCIPVLQSGLKSRFVKGDRFGHWRLNSAVVPKVLSSP